MAKVDQFGVPVASLLDRSCWPSALSTFVVIGAGLCRRTVIVWQVVAGTAWGVAFAVLGLGARGRPELMERADREIVRALGAVEEAIDVYIYRTPVQFSLVAELGHPASVEELADVLAALQDRYPVLGIAVDRAGPETVVRASSGAIPIEVAAEGTPWEYIVAVEQTRTAASGSPARAVLVPGDPGCAVVLTVATRPATTRADRPRPDHDLGDWP